MGRRPTQLHIAKDLSLPLEAVTQTFGILAKRGVGKTYTAAKMAEEMLKAGLRVVVLDPIGVWWGMRASDGGKSEGLPIVILGGDHADVPLDSNAGELIANLIVDKNISAVLDLSHFRKNEQNRFVTAFAERLYHHNRKPLHLMVDEADSFAPQRPQRGEERMLGAMEDLVRRGRARGIGLTLVTQRSAVLNKNVLSQVEVLIALRTIAPQDREAIDAWIDIHGDKDKRKKMLESMSSLEIGQAWFWSPGWLDIFQLVKVARRSTFDSSSTPKVGMRVKAPKRLAPVDIAWIKDQLASTIEKTKQEDPRELQKKILELTTQLQNKTEPDTKSIKEVFVEVKVPFLGKREIKNLVRMGKSVLDMRSQIEKDSVELLRAMEEFMTLVGTFNKNVEQLSVDRVVAQPPEKYKISPAKVKELPIVRQDQNKVVVLDGKEEVTLLAGERRMIDVLMRLNGTEIVREELGMLSILSPGGTFNNYYGRLKKLGYIQELGSKIKLVKVPADILNNSSKPINRQEVCESWKAKLLAGERRMFDIVLELSGKHITRQELGEKSSLVYPSGTYNNYLGALRRNGLVILESNEVRLSQILTIL